MIIVKYFLLSLVMFSGIINFSIIKPCATSAFKPLPTIFEDLETEKIHDQVTKFLIELMTYEKRTGTIIKLQNAACNLNAHLETQKLKLFFERQKSTLEKELLYVLSLSIEKYKELRTKTFFAKKLVALIQKEYFWVRKDFATQVNFIIRECID